MGAMEPIRERKEPNYNGTPIDLPLLRARMRDVANFIRGAKAHCRRTQKVTEYRAPTGELNARIGEAIDWSRLYELKAEATALCMLRAAMRGNVHASAIDASQRTWPSLRNVIAFATGGKPHPAGITSARAQELVALVCERMAERYCKSSPSSRAVSSAA